MKKNVVTASPKTTYREAAKILYENRFSGLPVIDDKGKLVGMLSEKDLFKVLYPNYEEYMKAPESYLNREAHEADVKVFCDSPVELHMTKKVITIGPSASVLHAGGLMLARHVHRLPVVENGELIGIVTREDIYGAILKHYVGF